MPSTAHSRKRICPTPASSACVAAITAYGCAEQFGPRHSPVFLVRETPAINRAGNCQNTERTARGNIAILAPRAVVVGSGHAGGRSAGIDAAHLPGSRFRDQPESVAAQPRHMRVDNAQNSIGGDGRINRASPALQDVQPRSTGEIVWRRDHAILRDCRRPAGSGTIRVTH